MMKWENRPPESSSDIARRHFAGSVDKTGFILNLSKLILVIIKNDNIDKPE